VAVVVPEKAVEAAWMPWFLVFAEDAFVDVIICPKGAGNVGGERVGARGKWGGGRQ
jgi:hypothetical protein